MSDPGGRDHRSGGRRRGVGRVPDADDELGCPSAGRRSTASACHAVSSACGFPRQVFSRSKAPPPCRGCATGWIRWTRCRRAWCAWSEAAIPFGLAWSVTLDDFWIDRFEVTNRQFKEFVDHGGYRRRDYWREPFVEGGRSVPWEEAVERFRDATGRPGPATWRAGTYPDGQAEFPVGGVSWYEAAAYAAFAGKSLPTMYHWYLCGAPGALRRHPDGQQLQRKRPGTGRQLQRPGPVRHLRHGGQREGMVLDRNRPPPISSGRRMERAEVHVCGLRCEGAVRAGAGVTASVWRSTSGRCRLPWPHPSGSRRSVVTPESRHRSAMTSSPCIEGSTPTIARPLNASVEATEETEIWAEAHRRIRRRVWRRAHARVSVPAEERIAAVPDRRLFSGGRRISSAIEPRPVARRGGLHHPERTRVALPGVQGDVRAKVRRIQLADVR